MMKWLAVWRQFWQAAWSGSSCRRLLLGSFFACWLIPMETDEATPARFAGSALYRLGNRLIVLIIGLIWRVGGMMRSLAMGSVLIYACRRVWQATMLHNGLSWWRSN